MATIPMQIPKILHFIGVVVVYLVSKSNNQNLDLDIVVITSGMTTMDSVGCS